MSLHPSSHKIAYKSGQIQGSARGLIIRKDMSREEIEKSLEQIIKWAKEIHLANKKLLPDITSKEETK